MRRGGRIRVDPVLAAERRRRRELRRQAEGPRPEDVTREARRVADQDPRSPTTDRSPHVARDSGEWYRHVTAGGCVMCAEFPVDQRTARDRAGDLDWIQGHHPIERDKLKRWGLAHLIWDKRNGLGVCAYHHGRHTHAVQRIPRRLLRPETFEFADEINARFLLEDDAVYPPDG